MCAYLNGFEKGCDKLFQTPSQENQLIRGYVYQGFAYRIELEVVFLQQRIEVRKDLLVVERVDTFYCTRAVINLAAQLQYHFTLQHRKHAIIINF